MNKVSNLHNYDSYKSTSPVENDLEELLREK